MQRFYIGTAEDIEAEYGATDYLGRPFVVYETWEGEGVSVEGFSTMAAAKAALADIEDRSIIEYVGA